MLSRDEVFPELRVISQFTLIKLSFGCRSVDHFVGLLYFCQRRISQHLSFSIRLFSVYECAAVNLWKENCLPFFLFLSSLLLEAVLSFLSHVFARARNNNFSSLRVSFQAPISWNKWIFPYVAAFLKVPAKKMIFPPQSPAVSHKRHANVTLFDKDFADFFPPETEMFRKPFCSG